MSDDEEEYVYSDEEGEDVYESESDNKKNGHDDGDDDHDGLNNNNNQEEEELSPEIRIENSFYEAEDLKTTNLPESLKLYQEVVKLETEMKTNDVQWRFKSLEQIILLQFKLGDHVSMVESYRSLLSLSERVTRNQISEAINRILDAISQTKKNNNAVAPKANVGMLTKMYEITLEVLKKTKNEGLWVGTNLKLGKMYLDLGDHENLEKICAGLHAFLDSSGKSAEITSQSPALAHRGTQLLEVYSLEISLYAMTKDKIKLREAYAKSKALDTAIQDPRIMGSIHEAGGMMYLEEGLYQQAYDELFDGFRAYQEAGNARAKRCLKLLVLANMITLSKISPFDSREAKVYKDDPEIQALVNLRQSFEACDVNSFDKILREPKNKIVDDPVLLKFTQDLLAKLRLQVTIHVVKPYSRVRIPWLASKVGVSEREQQDLLHILIQDGQLHGTIDQVSGIYESVPIETNISQEKKSASLKQWIKALDDSRKLFSTISSDNHNMQSSVSNGNNPSLYGF